jgi:hypothetical protein
LQEDPEARRVKATASLVDGESYDEPLNGHDVASIARGVLYVGDQVGELVTVCGARAHAVARPKVAGIVAAALVGVACAVAFVVAPVGAVSWPFAVVALVAVLAVFGLAGGDDR